METLKIAEVCRWIAACSEPPSLKQMAARANLSVHHFHRVFKSATGVTPKQFSDAERSKRLKRALNEQPTVTGAAYEAGFNSSGRFYESSPGLLGMSPLRYKKGGVSETIRFAVAQCSLGAILVASTDRGICAIFLGDEPESLLLEFQDRFPKAELVGGDKSFERMVARVVGFVESPRIGLDLPLDVRGTAFQQRVWQALRKIPAGSTASYADIARRIGSPKAVRAVAGACAANPVAVAVPCHRVVRADGGLSGYRWGIERKRALLDKERRR